MTRFTLIHNHTLTSHHFEEHPAWADYSEPDDIETIVSWGIEKAEIVKQLEMVNYSDEYVFPVLHTDPLPNFRFLYLRAEFTSAEGTRFTGYVLGQHPYCVGLFFGNEVFTFNSGLLDMARESLTRLRKTLRHPLAPFFPIHYSTPFQRHDGKKLEGEFYYNQITL